VSLLAGVIGLGRHGSSLKSGCRGRAEGFSTGQAVSLRLP